MSTAKGLAVATVVMTCSALPTRAADLPAHLGDAGSGRAIAEALDRSPPIPLVPPPPVYVAPPVVIVAPTCFWQSQKVWNGYMYVLSQVEVCS